jgi:formyltetrahydrofolate deformylase
MQVTITAVGPDNRGLADPIVHYVTGAGANICEIQMYDRDSAALFAMLMRIEWPGTSGCPAGTSAGNWQGTRAAGESLGP